MPECNTGPVASRRGRCAFLLSCRRPLVCYRARKIRPRSAHVPYGRQLCAGRRLSHAQRHAGHRFRKEDFEVLEDKVSQNIDQFEHVVIRGAGPQDARREPNTVAESRQAAQDPRSRVFVLFLDINHVELGASRAIRTPLIEALDRLIGQDDLIAVMTPEMSPQDVTFARRTTTIEGFLTRYWWGERDRSSRIGRRSIRPLLSGIPRPGESTASDQTRAGDDPAAARSRRSIHWRIRSHVPGCVRAKGRR